MWIPTGRSGLVPLLVLLAGALVASVAAGGSPIDPVRSSFAQMTTSTPLARVFGPVVFQGHQMGAASPTPAGPTPTSTATPSAPTPTATPTGSSGGAVRMVALGDSMTEGFGDSSQVGYPGRLLDEINRSRPGSTMRNFGRSGWTSTELIEGSGGEPGQLEAAAALSPNIALIWIGDNDLWYLYNNDDPTTADENADLTRYSANIDRMLSRLKATGAKLAIALKDDQSKRPGATDATFPGITPAEFTRMSAQNARYNDVIRQRAAQHGAVLVDLSNTSIFTNPALLDVDGIHPNDAGYDAITQIFLNAIRPLL